MDPVEMTSENVSGVTTEMENAHKNIEPFQIHDSLAESNSKLVDKIDEVQNMDEDASRKTGFITVPMENSQDVEPKDSGQDEEMSEREATRTTFDTFISGSSKTEKKSSIFEQDCSTFEGDSVMLGEPLNIETPQRSINVNDNAINGVDDISCSTAAGNVLNEKVTNTEQEPVRNFIAVSDENIRKDKKLHKSDSFILESDLPKMEQDGKDELNDMSVDGDMESEWKEMSTPATPAIGDFLDNQGPATPSSCLDTGSVGPTPVKRSRQNSIGSLANTESLIEDLVHHNYPATRLFEYQWPDASGEYYMLQEQISEYLGVKSFKRKYPELQRRAVDMHERVYLLEKGAVTESLCDLGLTALKSDEVHDLMHKDYPEKYKEYAAILHEREKQSIKEKHKDYGAPKLEKSKLNEYVKKSMKSASDWNSMFLRERREERRAYFDLQTFNVFYPKGRYKVLPADMTKPSPHPVALIPGQFQDHYKKYTPEELLYLPVGTIKYNPPRRIRCNLADPNANVEESSEEEKNKTDGSESESDSSSSSESSADENAAEAEVVTKEEITCRICSDNPEKRANPNEDLIECSECKKHGHPSCLDLTAEMVAIIKTYPWQCMECKTCVECMDPYDEDKMIFCDLCDRGYHTFCVGLRSIPNGSWKCRSCKGPETPRSQRSTPRSRGKGKRGKVFKSRSTPKEPKESDNSQGKAKTKVKDTPAKDMTPVRFSSRRRQKEMQEASEKEQNNPQVKAEASTAEEDVENAEDVKDAESHSSVPAMEESMDSAPSSVPEPMEPSENMDSDASTKEGPPSTDS